MVDYLENTKIWLPLYIQIYFEVVYEVGIICVFVRATLWGLEVCRHWCTALLLDFRPMILQISICKLLLWGIEATYVILWLFIVIFKKGEFPEICETDILKYFSQDASVYVFFWNTFHPGNCKHRPGTEKWKTLHAIFS